MREGTGPSPHLGLIAALIILIAGIASALTRADETSTHTAPGIVSSTRPLPASSTSTSTTPSTFTTLPTTALPPTTSTTVRPAVPTPEAAANGLWAAYTADDDGAAARFASPPVIEALFATPFSGEDGTFQGCRKRPSEPLFDCEYEQPTRHYEMTAEADVAASFKIVVITITG